MSVDIVICFHSRKVFRVGLRKFLQYYICDRILNVRSKARLLHGLLDQLVLYVAPQNRRS